MTSPLQISVEAASSPHTARKWVTQIIQQRPGGNRRLFTGQHWSNSKAQAETLADEWRTALQNLGGELVESGLQWCIVHETGERSDGLTCSAWANDGLCVFVPLCYRKPT